MLSQKYESDVENHITNRFELQKVLGRGAYGVVWRVIEKRSKNIYALKKIFDAFRNVTDAQRTYREICFLRELSTHPNVIKLFEVIKSFNQTDIYLVFEHMATDLDKVIRRGKFLNESHIKFISYQICVGLAFIHSANVVHRDLKPGNILISEHCRVKICDFGMARSIHATNDHDYSIMTDYIATRWYRAPEILLASNKYTTKVDVWSFGCIVGELLKGSPLFPGNSTYNQLELILKYFPPTTRKDISSMSNNIAVTILSRCFPKEPDVKQLQDFIGNNSSVESISLLINLLRFNPEKRVSSKECLSHNYFSLYRNSEDEISLTYDLIPPVHDGIRLSVDDYRRILFDPYKAALLCCEKIKKLPDKDQNQKTYNHPIQEPNQEIPEESNFQKIIKGFKQLFVSKSSESNQTDGH